MNNEKLNLGSIIKKGKYNGKTVNDIIKEERKEILNMVKKGYSFEEEVYEKAHYKHCIRDVRTFLEVVDRPKGNSVKTLSKDTEKLEKILESLSTLDNSSYDEENTFEDEEVIENLDF